MKYLDVMLDLVPAVKDGETYRSIVPSFDFDEEVLKVGAAYYDEVVRVALRNFAKGVA